MGQKSWNRMFEQEYLPHLVERDNIIDPITGMSKQQAELAREWVDLSIQDTNKKKQSNDPSVSFQTYRTLDGDDTRRERRPAANLPHISSSPESYNKSPSNEPAKLSKHELKAAKHKMRDLKNAKYASVTHNPDHLMYLQPTIKLGVKHGDSTRMKFPVQEFQESDLRLKKIKNGYSMIKLEEAGDSLFPVLYVKRSNALGIMGPARTPVAPSRQRIDHFDTHKRAEDIDARLEGELRDEFLSVMEAKMQNLDEQLQVRREKREDTYKSKEMLLKAAETIQKNHEQGTDKYKATENLWEKVKADVNNDPNLLVSRLHVYMEIVNYVEQNGGIQTETEEQIISLLRDELENGSPADKHILTKLILEFGIVIINDVQLQELISYIGEQLGVSPTDTMQMIQYYEKSNLMKTFGKHKTIFPKNIAYEMDSGNIDSNNNSTRMASAKRAASYFQAQYPRVGSLGPVTEKEGMTRVKSLDTALPPLQHVSSLSDSDSDSEMDGAEIAKPQLPVVQSFAGFKARRVR